MVIFVLQYPSSLALLLQPPCLPIMRFLVNSESPSGGQRASASPEPVAPTRRAFVLKSAPTADIMRGTRSRVLPPATARKAVAAFSNRAVMGGCYRCKLATWTAAVR